MAVFDIGISYGDFEQRRKNQDIVSSNHQAIQLLPDLAQTRSSANGRLS
jgi:hypothetical protein